MNTGLVASRPIVIVSYNRPDLLKPVLNSLRTQTREVPAENVFLFQDWVSAGIGTELQELCCNEFKRHFPEKNIVCADTNLGIALNFDRAEKFCFETLGADVAYFFEDDMILDQFYIQVLDQMAEFALADDRIAYVACYGNHTASRKDQLNRRSEIIGLGHKWGFALTRRQWLRQKPYVDAYLDIVTRRPYSQRDNAEIRELFRSWGFDFSGTSQDGAKDVASFALGTVKLNTFACFGRYIGEKGTHFNPKLFADMGFSRTELLGEAVELLPPSDELITRLLNDSKRWMVSAMLSRASADLGSPGEKADKEQQSLSVSSRFRITLPEAERNAVEEYYRGANVVLEYGSGGSTFLGSQIVRTRIFSVESDQHWLRDLTKEIATAGYADKFVPVFADIGATKEWGYPASDAALRAFPSYALGVWDNPSLLDPDIVLIDGRFRVACFLATAGLLKKDATVLFDDYVDRPHYHLVESIAKPEKFVGRMAIFKLRPGLLSIRDVLSNIPRFLDPS